MLDGIASAGFFFGMEFNMMKRAEKALAVFCVAAIPCFLISGIYAWRAEQQFQTVIADAAIGMILAFIANMMVRLSRNDLTEGDMCIDDTHGEKSEDEGSRDNPGESVSERVSLIEGKIRDLSRRVDRQEELIDSMCRINAKFRDETDGVHLTADGGDWERKQVQEEGGQTKDIAGGRPVKENTARNKPNELRVNLDPKSLDSKEELRSGDKIIIYPDGIGKYILRDYMELVPCDFKENRDITEEAYQVFKFHGIGKLFELNSRNIVRRKVTHIVPAKVKVIEKDNQMFEGRLIRKGRIEVDDSV